MSPLAVVHKKMNNDPKVYLIGGRTGAGKTTISKQLAHQRKGFRISHDEWLRIAYGPEATQSGFRKKCERMNDLIWRQIESLTELGIDVVLEGWGSRRLRDEARSRLDKMGIAYEFIYVECPREERWDRIQRRNESLGQEGFLISQDDFDRMEEVDEEFQAHEVATVIDNSRHNKLAQVIL